MDKVQIFQPTMEEFEHFDRYVCYMEARGAHLAGIAKVIPPKEWKCRDIKYDIHGIEFVPIHQVVTASDKKGFYQQTSVFDSEITAEDYKNEANSKERIPPKYNDVDNMDDNYWKQLDKSVVSYGSDVPGTFFEENCKVWNLNKLPSILGDVEKDYELILDGIMKPYLYFGMWKTTFAWHIEDMDLYAINYHHFGKPKIWHAIPPFYARNFEQLASKYFVKSHNMCPSFLRHKASIIKPSVIQENDIPVNKVVQNENEFIITFPKAYHFGYNSGFNCAEAVNFAMPRWIEYGKWAPKCDCGSSSIHISMDTFIKKYQKDQYLDWLAGTSMGRHPENPLADEIPVPKPNYQDFVMNKNNHNVPMAIIEEAMKGDLCKKSKSYIGMFPDFKSLEKRSDVPAYIKKAFKPKSKKKK